MSKVTKNLLYAEAVAEEMTKMPEPKPCWVQAFMLIMLHKLGGSQTISLADLRRFEELDIDNQSVMNYDPVKKTVTITAPEMIMPDKPKLVVPDKTIITPGKR